MAFTAQQVRQILQRAAEVEQDEARSTDSPGLSADELRAAATAAGFSEEALDRALHEFETVVPDHIAAPVPHFRTELLPVRLTQEVGEAFIAQLRTQFGDIGTVYEIGQAFEWHGNHNGRMVLCSVRPEANQTRVSLQLGDYRILSKTRDVWLGSLLLPLLLLLMAFGIFGWTDKALISSTIIVVLYALSLGVLVGGSFLHDRLADRTTQAALRTAFEGFSRTTALISGNW
ncbi:MAG: hypothetical protein RhofKO_19890 [Rhodothermales bacterium]